MAEWLYEAGIGEARAALVDDGVIVEAHIEPESRTARAGTVAEARLTDILIPARRGIATLTDGTEILIEPLPRALTKGVAVHVEILREAIPEPGKPKRTKGRICDAPVRVGPDLAARIAATGIAVRRFGVHQPDALEAAGWTECLEAAATGIVPFTNGALRISLTPAMTLIDVDGDGDPAALAVAGAHAAGAAIRRFGITGSIGIDLPTVAGRSGRLAAAAALDATLPPPFERTAVNGFGFMQIVRPRVRSSLCETIQHDMIRAQARALMRRAERAGIIGACNIVAAQKVIDVIVANTGWCDRLSRAIGGPVTFFVDDTLAVEHGHALPGY